MKLEHLLLGVLGVRPATGYDLKKFFDADGRFLRSNTQMSQVYRALGRMAAEGWIDYEIEPRPGPQDAKTYRLTPEGMTVFLDWLTGPYVPATRYQDPEFTARLSFAGFMDEEQLLRIVETELAARREQVARFRDRDITVSPTAGFPFDLERESAVSELLHSWGNEDVQRHINRLERLCADIRAGRLRPQT